MAALVEAQVGEDPEQTFDQVDGLVRSYAPDAPARPAGEPLPSVLVGSEPGSPSRGSAAPNRPRPNWPRWRRSSEASSVVGVPLSGELRSWGYTVSKGPIAGAIEQGEYTVSLSVFVLLVPQFR